MTAAVVTVGLITTLISGVLFYWQMRAFTGEFIRVTPTFSNVFDTIVLALQTLLGVGLVMRREAVRKALIFVSSVTLIWSLLKLVIYLNGSSVLSYFGVPRSVTRTLIAFIALRILAECVVPLFFIVFLTRRRIAELFG